MARVQVGDLQQIKLNPAPIQSDTYAAPARPQGNDNLARLADALGSFSNSLGNLSGVIGRPDKEADERAIMASQKRIDGLTLDEHRQLLASGERPVYANSVERQAMMAIHGSAMGQYVANKVQQQLATTQNWDAGNIEAEWIKASEEDLQSYGAMAQDPNFYAAYRRQIEAGRGQTIARMEQRKVDDFVQAKSDSAFLAIDTLVGAGTQAGKDPETIAKEIDAVIPQLGAKGVLGVNEEYLDKIVLDASARFAESQPEVALLMLTRERKTRNGATRSLATTPEFRDRVLQVQNAAKKAIATREETAFVQGIRDRNVALLEGGNLDAVEEVRYRSPVTGKEEVLTTKAQTDDALFDYRQKSPQIAAENKETNSQRMARELRAYRMSNQKHPDIEREVNGVFASASVSNVDDPEAQSKIARSIETYKWLRSESPQAAKDYVKSEDDTNFMELALMGQTYLGLDMDTSIGFAQRATKIAKEGGAQFSRDLSDKLDRRVKNLANKPGWLWDSDTKPANSAVAEQRVYRLAMAITQANGIDLDRAVDMAADAVKNTSTTYRGMLLNLQGMEVPDDLSDMLDEALSDFSKKSPLMMERNGLAEGDLRVVPAGSSDVQDGRFMIANEDGDVIRDDQGKAAYITLDQVRRRSAATAKTRQEDSLYNTVLENTARQRGITYGTDSDMQGYFFNQKTKEIYEPVRGEDRTTVTWKKTGKRLKNKAVIRAPGNWMSYFLENQRKLGKLYRETAVDAWNSLDVKIGSDAMNGGR